MYFKLLGGGCDVGRLSKFNLFFYFSFLFVFIYSLYLVQLKIIFLTKIVKMYDEKIDEIYESHKIYNFKKIREKNEF